MSRTHLIIPDAHIKPGQSHARVHHLAAFITATQPEVIIIIGDWFDLPALYTRDKGTLCYEGRRYQKDVDAGRSALEHISNSIAKVSGYRPQLEFLLGNHEDRIDKVVGRDPGLAGTIGIGDLGIPDLGWRLNKFLEPRVVDGIAYCHYFITGVMGRPVSGKYIGGNLLNKQHRSCIQGHNHLFDYHETRRENGGVLACTVGCYFTHWEDWAKAANQLYSRGLVVVDDVRSGFGYVKRYSMEEVASYA